MLKRLGHQSLLVSTGISTCEIQAILACLGLNTHTNRRRINYLTSSCIQLQKVHILPDAGAYTLNLTSLKL